MQLEKDPFLGNMYKFHTLEEEMEALEKIIPIIAPYGLDAEIPPGNILSRGVQGDEATYTRVFILSGPLPSWEKLAEISTEIMNCVPINRVHFEIISLTKDVD